MSRRGTQETMIYKPGEKSRGSVLGELVREVADKGSLTVWILGWRCRRCGHCWPIRQTHGADPTGANPSHLPKRCPACDSPRWTRPFINKRKGRQVKTIKGRTAYGRTGKPLEMTQALAAAGEDPLEEDAGSAGDAE